MRGISAYWMRIPWVSGIQAARSPCSAISASYGELKVALAVYLRAASHGLQG